MEEKIIHLRRVLTQDWNPIGLTLPADDDEYDRYLHEVISRHWSPSALNDFLLKAEMRIMGVAPDRARRKIVDQVAGTILTVLKKEGGL